MAKKATKKTAKKAVKKAAAKKAPVVTEAPVKKAAVRKVAAKKVPAKKVAAEKVPAKKPSVRKAAAKKAVAASASETRVVVKADVGFGNQLFIRGDNAGLSWENGTVLENTGSSTWEWSSSAVKGALDFKLLLNDLIWSEGENYRVEAGKTVTIDPEF